MSDFDPPPPPPPPDLAPPPGYAAYQPRPLRRVGGLRTAVIVLAVVTCAGLLLQVLLTPNIVDSARDFLRERTTEDQFKDDYGPYALSNALVGIAQLGLIVVSIIWLFRTIKNHKDLGREVTWGPGWAIGGWVLPPLVLYIIPMLVLRETYKASDPDSPPGDSRWKQSADTPLLWVWWVLFGLAPVVFLVVGLRQQLGTMSGDIDDLADSLDDHLGLLIVQGIVTIIAGIAWALLVRAVTERHRRLTREGA